MRKLLFILLLIPSVSNAQAVARLLRFLSPPVAAQPYNFIWLDTATSYRMKVMNLDTARNLILVNTGTPGTYNRVTTDIKGRVTSGAVDSSYTITRTFNSNFTISSTRGSWVVYSFSTTGNDSAFVHLEISSNGGGLWSEICRAGSDWTNATSQAVFNVSGRVPINNLVRIRTSGAGAANITYLVGQETQL